MTASPRTKSILVTSTISKKNKIKNKIHQHPSKSQSNRDDNVADLSGISPIKSPKPKRKVDFTKKEPNFKTKKEDNLSDLKKRLNELESKNKRMENEARGHKSKIHILTQQIQDKDAVIRNLEHKLPKVLADVSRSDYNQQILPNWSIKDDKNPSPISPFVCQSAVLEDNNNSRQTARRKWRNRSRGFHSQQDLKRGNWKERRDAMNRNHHLSQKNKDLEKQLSRKIEDLNKITTDHQRLVEESKVKDKIIRQRGAELEAERNHVARLELEFTNLRLQLSLSQDWSEEITRLQNENQYLYNEIRLQYDTLIDTEEDLKRAEKFVSEVISKFGSSSDQNSSTSQQTPSNTSPSRCNVLKNANFTWPPVTRRKWNLPQFQDEDCVPKFNFEYLAKLSEEGDNSLCYDQQHDDANPLIKEKEEVLDQSDIECSPFQNFDDSESKLRVPDDYFSQSDKFSDEDEIGELHDESLFSVNIISNVEVSDDVSHHTNGSDDWNSSNEFENSLEKSVFCNRLENLDFKLEILMNKLNNTLNKSSSIL